jgi:formate-dependent phosphoribosylglycinamide formyltransferase (GAR transformylase)
MPQANDFVTLIIENLTTLNVQIKRHANLPVPTISEEEVSAQSIQKVKIDEILNNIKIYEANIEDNLSVDTITNLMMLY